MSGKRTLGPALGLALLGAMALGAYLRWVLAGKLPLDWNFAHLRHAHSHLGYYGLLFPLAWLGWRRAGVALPGPRMLLLYSLANAVAFFGFVRAGYGPEAIIGSTVVAAIWLWTSWRLRDRWRDAGDPLAAVLPGVIAAEACVPAIAYFLDRDEALAYGLVTMFLTLLLLAVIVPSALSSLGRRVSWPALLVSALLGAAALGPWPTPLTRFGLAAYALLLAWTVWAPQGQLPTPSPDPTPSSNLGRTAGLDSGFTAMPAHLRTVWLVLALGMLGMAAGWLPNTRPVVIGAIHFLVLSPVLASLMPLWLRRELPVWSWWVYHGCVALLAAPLAAYGLGAGASMLSASALGGTLVLLWWLLVLAFQSRS